MALSIPPGLISGLVQLLILGLILLIVLGLVIYFWLVAPKRKWKTTIWERRGGYAIPVARDVVVEKRIKGKSAYIYWLKKRKYSVPLVTEEHMITFKNKSELHYLRVGFDYIPFVIKFNFSELDAEHLYLTDKNGKKIINPEADFSQEFQPLPYDVIMQMLSTDTMVEEMFAKSQGWWEKFAPIIGIALAVMLMIILMGMYFNFVKSSLEPINQIAQSLTAVAQALVGA